MCGIFGFVKKGDGLPDMNRLAAIAAATQQRGPHAFGFAWIDGRGRVRMFKQSGRIRDGLGLLAMTADARMLVGHCRFATHGDPADNTNNHPHPADGGWVVHNGVLRDHREIIREYVLMPSTDCDSEVIGLLIEELEGSLAERVIEACTIVGPSPLAVAGLWRSPQRLLVVRRGNPLYWAERREGFYFGSTSGGLGRRPPAFPDQRAISFSFRGRRTERRGFPVPEPAPTVTAQAVLF